MKYKNGFYSCLTGIHAVSIDRHPVSLYYLHHSIETLAQTDRQFYMLKSQG